MYTMVNMRSFWCILASTFGKIMINIVGSVVVHASLFCCLFVWLNDFGPVFFDVTTNYTGYGCDWQLSCFRRLNKHFSGRCLSLTGDILFKIQDRIIKKPEPINQLYSSKNFDSSISNGSTNKTRIHATKVTERIKIHQPNLYVFTATR